MRVFEGVRKREKERVLLRETESEKKSEREIE